MTDYKLTVILLTYNRSKYLKFAIDGVLSQTFKDFKFIIVDNGSTDNTEEIVREYPSDRIHYIRFKENIKGRNLFEYSETPYLIICHDDDIMMPGMLARELEIMENNQNVAVVFSNTSIIDGEGKIIKEKTYDIKDDIIYKKHEFIKDYCNGGGSIAFPTAMYRINIFKSNRIYMKEEIGPACDIYFWMEVNSIDNVLMHVIKDPLLNYRVHQDQDSAVNAVEMELGLYPYVVAFLKSNHYNYLIGPFSSIIKWRVCCGLLNFYHMDKISSGYIREKIKLLKKMGAWDGKIPFRTLMSIRLAANFGVLAKTCHNLKNMFKRCA